MFSRLKRLFRRSRRRPDERKEGRKQSDAASGAKLQKRNQPQSTYTVVPNESATHSDQRDQTFGSTHAQPVDPIKQDSVQTASGPKHQNVLSTSEASTSEPRTQPFHGIPSGSTESGDIDTSELEQARQPNQKGEPEILLGKEEFYDYEVDHRAAVVHENIRPHVHTVYEPQITRDIHYHEHRTLIQPIIDPEPEVLPAQHWLQDGNTGEMTQISSDVGQQLSNAPGIVTTHVNTTL